MIRKLIICIAVLVGFCPMAWGTVDDVPNPKTYDADNWVSDPDHILDSETKNKINDILQQLEDSLTIEVAVVALNSIGEEEPHEFAVTLFNRWGVGKAEDDNGLLILLTRTTIFRLLPFLWLGYFLHKYNDRLFKRPSVTLVCSLICFAFFLIFWKGDYDAAHRIVFFKEAVRFDVHNFIITLIRLGVGASGSIFFIALFKILMERVKDGRLWQICCDTGRNTLGIYCVQIYLLEFGLDHIPVVFNFPGAVFAQLIYAVIVLVLCDLLVRLIKKNKWTALFMLGR